MTTSSTAPAQRRLLFVHAHPDDESINNGATMARYAAEGVQVTLVTCTRGEQGEVIPERLAHLEGAPGDALGDHRVGELAAAMAALGVTDHRFLGDPAVPGRTASEVLASGGTVYRDSGMAYDHEGGVVPSPNPPDGAFAVADAEEPAELLAGVIRELRPEAVVSYEPGGGYGHPDHVQTHLVTMRAVDLASLEGPPGGSAGSGCSGGSGGSGGSAGSGGSPVPGWTVPKVYWVVMPESLMRATLGALATAEGSDYQGPDPGGRMHSMVTADDQVTTAIDAMDFTAAKIAALRAHETQVSVSADGAFYALSNGVRRPVMGVEFYRLVRGTPAPSRDDVNRETTLLP